MLLFIIDCHDTFIAHNRLQSHGDEISDTGCNSDGWTTKNCGKATWPLNQIKETSSEVLMAPEELMSSEDVAASTLDKRYVKNLRNFQSRPL